MCTEIEVHVPVMVDHDSPDVVDSEEIREDRAVGRGIACETYLLTSDVLIFEVFDGRIPIDHKFFYPEELKTRGGNYRLVARIESTDHTGQHFKSRVYHDKPIPGVYLYDDMKNGGYAQRMANPRGFVGRNELSRVSMYIKLPESPLEE
jgi:hypothetical protein